MTTAKHIKLQSILPEKLAGLRLDQALVKLYPEYSRSQWQNWIEGGKVQIDKKVQYLPKFKLHAGQTITAEISMMPQSKWFAQDIPLSLIYEDEDLLVINKPSGLVVHPGAGVSDKTLVNALLNYAPELDLLPRAGLIHRLDKGTSGLLVIARNPGSFQYLIQQMKDRLIQREYVAVVKGIVISGGTLTGNIGRDVRDRKRMKVLSAGGREAITHYRVLKRYRHHSYLRVKLETGRTHQIRVHLSHHHFPLIGDRTYDKTHVLPKQLSEPLKQMLLNFSHPALHAIQLTLTHPVSQQTMTWTAELPADIRLLLDVLEEDLKAYNE